MRRDPTMASSGPDEARAGGAPPDVRLRGFADRVTVERAEAWVDHHAVRLAPVEVGLDESLGRVLAAPLAAAADHPPFTRAAEDGYAVRSADTVGASAYSPVLLRSQRAGAPLPPCGAALVRAGDPLPPSADAVVGFDAALASGPDVEIIAAAAEGSGVERRGQAAVAGAPLAAAGRPIRIHDLALLAAVGLDRVPVVARPRVRIVVAGAKGATAVDDAHRAMLRALVERDGGAVEAGEAGASLRDAFLRAASAPRPDLLITTGRTGTGADDEAPAVLAEAGTLAFHGIAVRPGGSTAMGLAGAVPAVLLPGDPLACLVAYELFAGRFVRRLGGRDPGLPHPTREAELARKIVSAVGSVDVCQVRLVAGRVEPIGVAEYGGLAPATRADGFVIVPAALEGYAPGVRVTVHTY